MLLHHAMVCNVFSASESAGASLNEDAGKNSSSSCGSSSSSADAKSNANSGVTANSDSSARASTSASSSCTSSGSASEPASDAKSAQDMTALGELLRAAIYFKIDDLYSRCVDCIGALLSSSNFCLAMNIAQQCQASELAQRCSQFLRADVSRINDVLDDERAEQLSKEQLTQVLATLAPLRKQSAKRPRSAVEQADTATATANASAANVKHARTQGNSSGRGVRT